MFDSDLKLVAGASPPPDGENPTSAPDEKTRAGRKVSKVARKEIARFLRKIAREAKKMK